MNTMIDLYGYFGTERTDHAGGRLLCLVPMDLELEQWRRTRPAVLILPGGGYHHTSLREAEPVALRFAAAGFAAFVLHYSCAPARYPAALREAAMAMRYIRENADDLGIDPGMVAALGFSAGGHLCGCLGTMYDSPELADIGSGELLRPDALCLCYPVTVSHGRTHEGSFENLCGGDGELRRRLSLDALVRPDMPPVFLWHTRSDASVPCVGTLILARALEEAGVDFALHIYRKGVHGLATGSIASNGPTALEQLSPDVSGWMEACMEFFGEIGLRIKDEGRHI